MTKLLDSIVYVVPTGTTTQDNITKLSVEGSGVIIAYLPPSRQNSSITIDGRKLVIDVGGFIPFICRFNTGFTIKTYDSQYNANIIYKLD